jgi:serine/threonine protein kinase
MAGRPFGRFEVLARLATGGAASIFLAREAASRGRYALSCVKILLPERARDDEFVDMFLDEAKLLRRLDHPNCVQIHDLGKERGVFYIAMEYIFGETLWNLLATVAETRVPLPPPAVAALIAAACDGLHAAHELQDAQGRPYNLVHRDVSPQNIMVAFDGRTKVLDFGVAKAETGRQATATGIVKGKFSYMSPEQITGGSVDRRSDLFSIGIVLFECLASRRLYRADTPEEIAMLMLERRPPRLREVVPELPAELDTICAKALARHPSGRFSTAAELADALRQYVARASPRDPSGGSRALIRERFGERIERRRRILEAVQTGPFDDTELLASLGARPVFDVDLFPNVDGPVRLEPSPRLSFTPEEAAAEAREVAAAGARRAASIGPGWRVEIAASSDAAVEALGAVEPPPSLGAPAADASEAATRFEAERTQLGEDENATQDRTNLPDLEERLGSIPEPSLDTTHQELADGPTFPFVDPSEANATLDASPADAPPFRTVSLPTAEVAIEAPGNTRPVPVLRGQIPVGASRPVIEPRASSMPLVRPVVASSPPDAPMSALDAAVLPGPSLVTPVPPGSYTLGVVLSAFAFGLTLGILIGVVIALLI